MTNEKSHTRGTPTGKALATVVIVSCAALAVIATPAIGYQPPNGAIISGSFVYSTFNIPSGNVARFDNDLCIKADFIRTSGTLQAIEGPNRDGPSLYLEAPQIVIDGAVEGLAGADADAANRDGGHGSTLFLRTPALAGAGTVRAGPGGNGGDHVTTGTEAVGGNGGHAGWIVLDGLTIEEIVPTNLQLWMQPGGEAGSGLAEGASATGGNGGDGAGIALPLATVSGIGESSVRTSIAPDRLTTQRVSCETTSRLPASGIVGQLNGGFGACDGKDGKDADNSGTDSTTDGTDGTSGPVIGGTGGSGGDGAHASPATGGHGGDGCLWGSGGDGGNAHANGGDGAKGGDGGSGTVIGGPGGRGGDGGRGNTATGGDGGCGGVFGPSGRPGMATAWGGQGGAGGAGGAGLIPGSAGAAGTPGVPGTATAGKTCN